MVRSAAAVSDIPTVGTDRIDGEFWLAGGCVPVLSPHPPHSDRKKDTKLDPSSSLVSPEAE